MKTPKVSLCMPVFNGANFIGEALASISSQTFEDYDLIVTDNASTDETADIVRSWAKENPRIRYIRNDRNLGAAENYNIGFRQARGEYLKWCAHDDVLDPGFLEALVALLDAQPDVALAFCAATNIDLDGQDIGLVTAELEEVDDDDPALRFRRILDNSMHGYPIFGLFRREVLEKTGLHRPYYSSDLALLAEVMILGKLRFAKGATFYCRLHDKQSVRILSRSDRIVWQLGEGSRFQALEKLNYYRHLNEIAGSQDDPQLRRRLRRTVWRAALSRHEASRIAFELVQMVAPSASDWMRITRRKLLGRTTGSRTDRT